MANAIPPVPRGLGLSRELINYLEAIRMAVGGDTATTAPSVQADVLGPVAALVPASSASAGADTLAPAGTGISVTVGLS